jgi:hypothetical protein
MAMKRTIECDVCPASYTEESYGLGFPHWGAIQGVQTVEGDKHEMSLCPECLQKVMNYAISLQGETEDQFIIKLDKSDLVRKKREAAAAITKQKEVAKQRDTKALHKLRSDAATVFNVLATHGLAE